MKLNNGDLKIITFMIACLILSCRDSGTNPSLGGHGLIPMKAGNEWLYRRTIYDTAGAAKGSFYYDTSRIYRDTIIQNEQWFDFQHGGMWTNRADGVYLWIGVKAIKQFTLFLGDSVYYPAPDKPWGGSIIKLVSITTHVTVPSGNYTAYEYHYVVQNSGIIAEKIYIVPNTGIIKRELWSWTIGRRQSTLDLSDATIN